MATPDCRFSSWDEVSDDSKFVYDALARLGFTELSTLPLADIQVVLALAQFLKRAQGCRETWES